MSEMKISKMEKLKENPAWPDEVRLKMIDKSKFYEDDRVFQYGYYDGYQEALSRHKKQINNHDRLVYALERSVEYRQIDFDLDLLTAKQTTEFIEDKQLLTELKS